MKKLLAFLNTPARLVIAVAAVVFGVELLFMALLHEFLMPMFEFPGLTWGVIDAVTLAAAVALLYFLVFQKIQESEERFRQINTAALNAIVIINEQGVITGWNPAAQKMFQYSPEEALGQPMHRLIASPRYHEDAARGFASFEETGGGPLIGKTTEIAALRKDGSEFPIELSISAVKLKNSWHAIGVIRDITKRKQAEAALRAHESQLQTIVENLTEGLAVSDLDGQLLHFNRVALDLHGFATLDECLLRLPEFADTFELTAMDGTVLPLEQWPLARILRGENLRDMEVGIRHLHAGWRKVFNYGGTLVRDGDGQPLMAIVTIGDITKRKKTESQLIEQIEELRRWHEVTSGREKRILVIKHEVNELLAQAGQPPRYPSAEQSNAE